MGSFADEGNIRFLADYVRRVVGPPSFGICHGTRGGMEQSWFRDALECDVIGTEIAEEGASVPHTIVWDFHEVKPEWLRSVDFIYSNAWDHSYDPEKALIAWMSCLSDKGVCLLEHTPNHQSGVSPADCFSAKLEVLPYLLTKWGRGRFGVREILEGRPETNGGLYRHFIVLQNWR